MNVKVLPVGAYEANCSILWKDPKQAWVIDPGADAPSILAALRAEGLTPALVVLTHAHFDHVSALNALLAEFPVSVLLHPNDVEFAFSPLNAMPPYKMTTRPVSLVTDKQDGDLITCGGVTARVIHTPGHTPGGWCLYFEQDNLLVAGDTLFAGSVGRTDFPGGSWTALEGSLAKLKQLPDHTRVICGHGPETTLGVEKRNNPYLKSLKSTE